MLRCAYGLVLLLAPARLLALAGLRTDRGAQLFARVLGARHLVQWAVLPPSSPAGFAIDAVHAASALVLAAGGREHRRGLVLNAAFAALVAWDERGRVGSGRRA